MLWQAGRPWDWQGQNKVWSSLLERWHFKEGLIRVTLENNITDNFHRTHDDFLECRTHVKAGSWSMQIRF